MVSVALCLIAIAPDPTPPRDLRVPPGFEIVRVAGTPLVNRPVVAAFDDDGFLFVLDSSGSNEAPSKQVQNPTHRVVRLQDSDGDGVFDRATVFADKLPFSQGVMCRSGAVYVGSPPVIYKLTDTDGDGVSDARTIWFDGKTLTGCANDLHGPYPGPDGRIYWTKGAFARQQFPAAKGGEFTTTAAHVFRATADGTNVESIAAGGMDNPVDVVFTPTGDAIATSTFLQHPAAGKRDGLFHAIYGGLYGKDHDPVRDPARLRTRPDLMPVLTHLGPAAPSGLHRYESESLGRGFRDNLFCAQFNIRAVSRHEIVPSGSAFTTRDTPFVSSDDPDFHPTDVIEDADGSLLVIDTGGWYKLCCPTAQFVRTEAFGGIYRVRKTGAPAVADPRGAKIDWPSLTPAALADLLGDARPVVRRRAAERFTGRPDEPVALSAAARGGNPTARVATVWAAVRSSSVPTLIEMVSNADPAVREAACRGLGTLRVSGSATVLTHHLRDNNFAVRRAAAEALGRVGDAACIPDVFNALANAGNDWQLDHALTYGLLELGDKERTTAGLKYPHPAARRAALIVLAQLPNGLPDAKPVLDALDSQEDAVRETAWWAAARHPEWEADWAAYFRTNLGPSAGRLPSFAKLPAVQAVITEAAVSPITARDAFAAMAAVRDVPASWKAAAVSALAKPELTVAAVAAIRSWPAPKTPDAAVTSALLAAGTDANRDPQSRLAAFAAVQPGLPEPAEDTFALLLAAAAKDRGYADRSTAVDVLSRAALSPPQVVKLAESLPAVAAADVPKLVPAFARAADAATAKAVVKALSAPVLRDVVRAEVLEVAFKNYPAAARPVADALLAALRSAAKADLDRVAAVAKDLPAGDVRRGQIVFQSAKAACAACHTIGYKGGTVGPDLTRIGSIRAEKDLLESVLLPSASFVRSYEPVVVTTHDGRTVAGVVKADTAEEIELAVDAEKRVRLPRSDIEAVTPGKVSVMPAGLEQQLSRQELADLIAFLKACR